MEVDLNALAHNFKFFKSLIKPGTKTIGMVKASGYGAGSYEIAKTLQDCGCDYLAVAVHDEGIDLRKASITMTRIYRAAASFEAGQDKELVKLNHPPYIRVLGFNREGRYCLKIMGKCTKLPVISNPSDALELCSANDSLKKVFELEMRASAIANELYGRDIAYAWTSKPVMI